MSEKTKVVHLRIPEDVIHKIAHIAVDLNTRTGTLMTAVLTQWVEHEQTKKDFALTKNKLVQQQINVEDDM